MLRNRTGERFMKPRPHASRSSSLRDMVARAMYREIREGRGIEGQDYLHLDLTHLGRELIDARLPDITGFVRTYLGIDAVEAPIPVQPTAALPDGGIPTDMNARVVIDENNTPLPGLYAAGECACVSVHGAKPPGDQSPGPYPVFGRLVLVMPRGSWPKMIGRCCLRGRTSELRTWFTRSGLLMGMNVSPGCSANCRTR